MATSLLASFSELAAFPVEYRREEIFSRQKAEGVRVASISISPRHRPRFLRNLFIGRLLGFLGYNYLGISPSLFFSFPIFFKPPAYIPPQTPLLGEYCGGIEIIYIYITLPQPFFAFLLFLNGA